MTATELSAVERVLGYRFRNRDLRIALLPPSGARPSTVEFQRLEFLGDRVLGLLVAERLFAEFPQAPEGALSVRLSYLASGDVLSIVARESGLADAVAADMAPEPFPSHRRALGDCVEAALGALWRDGGTEAARSFIERHLGVRIVALTAPPQDAKTALQEWTLARQLPLPVYTVLDRTGEDHGPVFDIEVRVKPPGGHTMSARACGRTKRAAEKDAAAQLLERLAPLQ